MKTCQLIEKEGSGVDVSTRFNDIPHVMLVKNVLARSVARCDELELPSPG